MGAVIIAAVMILSALLYGWFVFIWLTNKIANIIDIPFSKASDDEVTGLEGQVAMGQVQLREVTRGDRRIRLISIFIVLPLIIGLHYVYWEPFYAGVQWVFEEVLAPFIRLLAELLGVEQSS